MQTECEKRNANNGNETGKVMEKVNQEGSALENDKMSRRRKLLFEFGKMPTQPTVSVLLSSPNVII
jgi:hypothetical protein